MKGLSISAAVIYSLCFIAISAFTVAGMITDNDGIIWLSFFVTALAIFAEIIAFVLCIVTFSIYSSLSQTEKLQNKKIF